MLARYMISPVYAGVAILILGFIAAWRELAAARGMDKLLVTGRVFLAAPLAVFGAEHLAGAKFVVQIVPKWMPFPMFWVYFVAAALFAAAISIALMKFVRLSALLLGIMLVLFVLTIHLPGAAATPNDRIIWAVAMRDLSFAGGAFALAGKERGSNLLVTLARFMIGGPLIFFAIEHFLHPEFVPGVPLAKVTVAWVPLRAGWGYLTGAFLLAAGACILVNRYARTAAAWMGAELILVLAIVYVPILMVAVKPPEVGEAVNYFFDTLMFAGAILLYAAAQTVRVGSAPAQVTSAVGP